MKDNNYHFMDIKKLSCNASKGTCTYTVHYEKDFNLSVHNIDFVRFRGWVYIQSDAARVDLIS